MKSVLAFFTALFICAIGLSAQNADLIAADSILVEEETMAARLQNPSARVIIDAPYALWLRVNKTGTSRDSASEDSTENTDEKSDAESSSQQKARGKSVGYRVQVFADNNARSAKSEARQREKSISGAFPQYGTYVTYASPFWRLRIGDFKSQYDAEKAAAEIKRQFPGYAREVRVVRDRVNLK